MNTYVITSSNSYDSKIDGVEVVCAKNKEAALQLCHALHPDWSYDDDSTIVGFPGKLTPLFSGTFTLNYKGELYYYAEN